MMRGSRACHAKKQLGDPDMFHPEQGKLKETLIVHWSETHRVRRLGLFFYRQKAKLRPKRESQRGLSFCSEKSQFSWNRLPRRQFVRSQVLEFF